MTALQCAELYSFLWCLGTHIEVQAASRTPPTGSNGYYQVTGVCERNSNGS